MPSVPSRIAQRYSNQQQNNPHLANPQKQNGNNNGPSTLSTVAVVPIPSPAQQQQILIAHPQQIQNRQQRTKLGQNDAIKSQICKKIDENLGDAHCCCGLLHLRHGAAILGVCELLIITYQLVICAIELLMPTTTFDNDHDYDLATVPTTTANTVHSLLTVISLLLAITAVLLMLLGVWRRSPYALMPHLLMQIALMVATLIILCYLVFWLLGGINVHISAIFYDNSAKGIQGLKTAMDRPSTSGNFTINHLRIIIWILLGLTLLAFGIQIMLFRLVHATFRYLLRASKELGSETDPTETPTTDTCTTVMMMSTISSRESPPNNGINPAMAPNDSPEPAHQDQQPKIQSQQHDV